MNAPPRTFVCTGILATLLLAALTATRSPCDVPCEIVSVSSTGEIGNGSSCPSLSADGSFVAFASSASNLVPADTNNAEDVFVRDRLIGKTERVSVSSGGEQGNGHSWSSSISADGMFVAFESQATNLVAGDTNGTSDVLVHYSPTGATERVSVSTLGQEGNGESSSACIGAYGRYVAFQSDASNLVPGDANGATDVFVRDRLTGQTARVSVASNGTEGDRRSWQPAISANGRYVAFTSAADNLILGDTNGVEDVFVHDRQTGETTRVNVASDGREANDGSAQCSISEDGTCVAFWTWATNLEPVLLTSSPRMGQPGCCSHMYVHNRLTAQTVAVPLSSDYMGSRTALTADGGLVASDQSTVCLNPVTGLVEDIFESVFVYNAWKGGYALTPKPIGCQGLGPHEGRPALSADGRYVAYETSTPTTLLVVICALPNAPPQTEIVSGPCGQAVCAGEANICWTGSDNETPTEYLEYLWRVDGAAWEGPTSDTCITLANLADGQHTIEVKARDRAGNEDSTPAECTFWVDALGPAIVSVDCVAGPPGFEGLVNITVTASDPGGSFTLEPFVNGQPVGGMCGWTNLGGGPVSGECHWNLDVTPALMENGAAEICIKAWDECRNESQQCISVTVSRQTFEDVPNTSPFWPYVEAIASRGITAGCSADPPLYCPYAQVTRAQMAKFTCLAAGKTWLDRETPTFADVPKGHPAYGWIERLADGNSWGGTPPTAGCEFIPKRKFCPGSAVTREYLAMVLCLATGKSQAPSCSGKFADVSPMNPFCRFIERLADAASWPGGVAVTSGCGVNPLRYCPTSPVTRGQMAVFLVRALGLTY